MMHVAYLDTNVSPTCPTNLTKYEVDGKIFCGRHNDSQPINLIPCDSVSYPTKGIKYSNICGRAVGYTHGPSTGAFRWSTSSYYYSDTSIDGLYVSGVTITRGPANDRTHVWTYASGYGEDGQNSQGGSPCNTRGSASPIFVGDNYFCETATVHAPQNQWYTNYTMWQGNCYEGSNCCPDDGRPWFNVALDSPTNQDIEVRWCGLVNQRFAFLPDNIGVEKLEIYVY